MAKINVNKIIRCLLVPDFLFYPGWGLILPAFAVFVTENIDGGDIIAVGIGAGLRGTRARGD